MPIAIVMGLPGAGKSTVLSVLGEGSGFKLVNYGDLMFEIASERGFVSHRDDLRKLDTATQSKVQSEVGQKLAYMDANLEEKIVLDTHCSILTPKGYLPGLPLSLLSKLHVDRLVLVTAPIEEILGRRSSDASRVRDAQLPESLGEHDSMNRFFLASYSMATGAPAAVIVNADGKLKEAQQQLLSVLK